jgi:hypothetical protein
MVMEHNEKGTLDDRLKLAEKQLSDAKLEQLHIDVYINTLVEEIRVLKPKGDGESNLKKDSTSKLGEPIGKVGVDQAIKSVIKAANSSKNNA